MAALPPRAFIAAAIAGSGTLLLGVPPAAPERAGQGEPDRAALAPAPQDAIAGLWLSTGLGYRRVALRTFVADPAGLGGYLVAAEPAGVAPSLALGARLSFATFGVRASRVALRAGRPDPRRATLWDLGAEIGARGTSGRLRPFALLGGGFARAREEPVGGVALPHARGLTLRLGGGLDWFVSPRVAVGARAELAVLALVREGVALSSLLAPHGLGWIADAHGSSFGASGELALAVSVHF
jgi:hypothetical protein